MIIGDYNIRTSSGASGLVSKPLYENILPNIFNGDVRYPCAKVFMIKGIGYQADVVEVSELVGNDLVELYHERYVIFRLGHSFPLYRPLPDFSGVAISHKDRKIVIYGHNKEQLSNFFKSIYGLRPPNVYTGRGLRIKGSPGRRKLGKKDIKKGRT